MLGLATVRVHRAQFGRHDKPEVVRIGDRLLTATVWVVAVLAAGVLLLIFDVVFGVWPGVIAFLAALVGLVLLLLVLPRSFRRQRAADERSTT